MEKAVTGTTTINYLPMEILQMVLCLLDPLYLLNCREVNKTWNQLILNSKLWKKIPIPRNPWTKITKCAWDHRLRSYFSPTNLASFLNRFNHIHLNNIDLPPDI